MMNLVEFCDWAAKASKQELENWLKYGSPMSPEHQQDVHAMIRRRVQQFDKRGVPKSVLEEIEALENQLLRNSQIPGIYRHD